MSRLPGQVVAGSPVVVTCRGEGGHPTPQLEASLVTHKGERSLQVQVRCGAGCNVVFPQPAPPATIPPVPGVQQFSLSPLVEDSTMPASARWVVMLVVMMI